MLSGGQVFGTNKLGIENNALDKTPWPPLLEARENHLFVISLNERLVGPSNLNHIACLDETPFHLFLTELYTIVFGDIGEEAASFALKEASAWTILLLSFANGDLGPSLLICESPNKNGNGEDIQKAQGGFFFSFHFEEEDLIYLYRR